MTPKKHTRPAVTPVRAVGATPDGSAIVLARPQGGPGRFKLAIDSGLVEALEAAREARDAAARARDQLELPPPIPARVESSLTIKEIQDLLRQGRTTASIAKRAGVDAEWIARWEGPIVWERAGMAARARRAAMVRARGGRSRASLLEAVEANLKEKGIQMSPDDLDAGWDAMKRPRANGWIVSFTFSGRGGEQTARWELDPHEDLVRALDKTANELGWIPPIRRRSKA
ncbi:MAG TPA: septation protein SepH [Actinomycetota bacterium]|nr:septation protein SepH [Actinomycetota bacterium]